MCIVSEDLTRVLPPEDPELGWLAQAGRVPLGYLGDRAKTEKTFPVIEGVRYSVPGDRARIADGLLEQGQFVAAQRSQRQPGLWLSPRRRGAHPPPSSPRPGALRRLPRQPVAAARTANDAGNGPPNAPSRAGFSRAGRSHS